MLVSALECVDQLQNRTWNAQLKPKQEHPVGRGTRHAILQSAILGSILFAPETATETRTCSFCIFGDPESPHVLRLCGSVFGRTLLENSWGFLTEKYYFGKFTHFEFPALSNSSCHWSVKLLGDDLHLEWRKCRLQTKKKWLSFSAKKIIICALIVIFFVWKLTM